jgi:hypothetical protein
MFLYKIRYRYLFNLSYPSNLCLLQDLQVSLDLGAIIHIQIDDLDGATPLRWNPWTSLWQKTRFSCFIVFEVTSSQCFRSGTGLDPDSVRSVDPDPYSENGSETLLLQGRFCKKTIPYSTVVVLKSVQKNHKTNTWHFVELNSEGREDPSLCIGNLD